MDNKNLVAPSNPFIAAWNTVKQRSGSSQLGCVRILSLTSSMGHSD